jgi:hypothetical protein
MRLLIASIFAGITLCTVVPLLSAHAEEPTSLDAEEAAKALNKASIRLVALREFAFQKGIAEGRVSFFREKKIEQLSRKSELDAIYQVDHLYLRPEKTVALRNAKGVIENKQVIDPAYKSFLIQPPVILTGVDLYQVQTSGRSVDWSQVRYKTASQAMFVTAPIYWESFLTNDEDLIVQGPADDPLLRPRNLVEEQAMENFYQIAVAEGRAQALSEILARIKTLTTIIVGMNNYHILADKNVVSRPQVATGYIPVSGNKTQLTLSTFNAAISKDADFNLNTETYKSYVTPFLQ